MSKLLSANFMRLKKDKFFWIGIIFMFAAGVLYPTMIYRDVQKTGIINTVDDAFCGCTLFIGVVMAVFCSLFIGTEYSDGTIRNKIAIGHTRTALYLSNAIVSATVSIFMCAAFFIPYLCIGIPLLGFFEMNTKLVFLFGLVSFLLAIAFSSIFTLIAMLNHNKPIAAIICILLAFLFLIAGIQINGMLSQPKTIIGYTTSEDGQGEYIELENPKYLEGSEREVVQFLYDFIPGGQVAQCMSMEAVNIEQLPIYSLLMVVVSTGVGLIFFKKKDLK